MTLSGSTGTTAGRCGILGSNRCSQNSLPGEQIPRASLNCPVTEAVAATVIKVDSLNSCLSVGTRDPRGPTDLVTAVVHDER